MALFRIIGAVCALGVSGLASAADFRAESEQLAREIVEIHPRGGEIDKDPSFVAARQALFDLSGDTDYVHYAMALGRMFAAANDGHTAAIPAFGDDQLFTWRYPLRVQRFEDGLYVVEAKDEAAPLIGLKIDSVGGRPSNEILREFVKTGAQGNRAWPANFLPYALAAPGWLVGLDIIAADLSSPVLFSGKAQNGRRVSAMLKARADGGENRTQIERVPSPMETAGDGSANYTSRLKDGRVLALVVAAMEDSETKTFEAFTAEAQAALSAPNIERVIIDLRNNGGGNNMLAEPLRRVLVKSRFNRIGGLYVLISPATFSAAMNFATRLERETDAIFVGEPTGGVPNHFGDAKFSQAPISKIPYIISTLRWQDSSPFDERRWILPDIPAAPTFKDFIAGRDAAMEAAIGHDAGPPSTDEWRERVVKPWERSSQSEDWRFFFEAR